MALRPHSNAALLFATAFLLLVGWLLLSLVGADLNPIDWHWVLRAAFAVWIFLCLAFFISECET